MKKSTSLVIDRDARARFGDLAEKLMCAYISHQGGISVIAAEKRYGRKSGTPLGDYWIMLAMRTAQEVIEVKDWERCEWEKREKLSKKKGRAHMSTRPRQD